MLRVQRRDEVHGDLILVHRVEVVQREVHARDGHARVDLRPLGEDLRDLLRDDAAHLDVVDAAHLLPRLAVA